MSEFRDIREIEDTHGFSPAVESLYFPDLLKDLIEPDQVKDYRSRTDQLRNNVFSTLVSPPRFADFLEGRGSYAVVDGKKVYSKGIGHVNSVIQNPNWELPGFSPVNRVPFIDRAENSWQVPRIYGAEFASSAALELIKAARLLTGYIDSTGGTINDAIKSGFAAPINFATFSSVTSPKNSRLRIALENHDIFNYPQVGAVSSVVPSHIRTISHFYLNSDIPYNKIQNLCALTVSGDYVSAVNDLSARTIYENVGRTLRTGLHTSGLTLSPRGSHLQDFYAVDSRCDLVFAERSSLIPLEFIPDSQREFIVGFSLLRLLEGGLRGRQGISSLARESILSGLANSNDVGNSLANMWKTNKWDVSFGVARGLLQKLSSEKLERCASQFRDLEDYVEPNLRINSQADTLRKMRTVKETDMHYVSLPGAYGVIGPHVFEALSGQEIIEKITTPGADSVASLIFSKLS